MLFKDIIPAYAENHTKPIIQNTQLLIVKAGDTYSYHWALKDQFIVDFNRYFSYIIFGPVAQ
jgi:hypothetical protein